jgi:hypothetical protein
LLGPVVPYFGVAAQAPVQGSLLFRAAGGRVKIPTLLESG